MSVLNSSSNGTSDGGVDRYNQTLIIALLGVLAVFIFCANSFVIYLYLHRSELRTNTNLCLVFLAVSDLLAAVVVIPIVILTMLLYPSDPQFSVEKEILKIVNDFASRFVAFSNVFHLLLVTLERYIMIVFPMRYVNIVNRKRVKACLLFLWCFSLTLVLIQLSWIIPLTNVNIHADFVYSTTTFFGIIIPVFLLLVSAYYHIYREVQRQIKSIKQSTPALLTDDPQAVQQNTQAKKDKRREARAVIIFAVMLCAFVIGWFPYFILGIAGDIIGGAEFSAAKAIFILLLCMRFSVSFINPLLYTFLKEDFKKALRKTLRFPNQDMELNNRGC